jgi:hypothetical protein
MPIKPIITLVLALFIIGAFVWLRVRKKKK